MLKLSDEDFEKLGLTAGARKKIRVNLEVLRYIYKYIVVGSNFVKLSEEIQWDEA